MAGKERPDLSEQGSGPGDEQVDRPDVERDEVVKDLAGIAEVLYGLPLAEFTAARDERSRALRRERRRDLATQVGRLGKPTAPAWLVNQLVRHEAERIAELLALGEALRAAQADLDADQLRLLATQRRQLTRTLAGDARTLGERLGACVSDPVTQQVELTLNAAMLDAGAAAAVRCGLLLRSVQADGVEPVDPALLVAVPAALGHVARPSPPERPQLHVVPDQADSAQAQAERARRVAEAERAVAERQRAYGEAASEVESLLSRAASVREEAARLEERLGELGEELDRLESATDAAERARDQEAAALHTAQLVRHRACQESAETEAGP